MGAGRWRGTMPHFLCPPARVGNGRWGGTSHTFSALLQAWVMGDGKWGTKPHYPEKVFSPPSKETQKDHLGAIKQINKSLLLRAWWLPLTQQMLRSSVLPKRVLLSDISEDISFPNRLLPRWWGEWELVFERDGHHTAIIRSLFSMSLTLHEIKVVFTLHWTHPLPSLLPPFFENTVGKWCRQLIPWKVLGFLSNSSSTGRQAGKQTTVTGVSAP